MYLNDEKDYHENCRVENYYGGICYKEDEGKYYWGVGTEGFPRFEEIPKSLYDEIIKFEEGIHHG